MAKNQESICRRSIVNPLSSQVSKDYQLEVLGWILRCLVLSHFLPPVHSRRSHTWLSALPGKRFTEVFNQMRIFNYWDELSLNRSCHEAATDVVPVLLAQILSNLAGGVIEMRGVEIGFKKLPLVAKSIRWQRTQKLIHPSFLEGKDINCSKAFRKHVKNSFYKLTEWATERSFSIARQAVRPQRIWLSLHEHVHK